MIIRRRSDFDLFIKTEPLHAIRIYDEDYIVEFKGLRLEYNFDEISKLRKALDRLQTHPRDSLVFDENGKMMKWYYDYDKNHGSPVELDYDSSTQTVKPQRNNTNV